MRKKSPLTAREGYTPNLLLDTLMERLETKSDAALARALAVPPSTISKVRHKQVAVNSELLLAAHEMTGMSIRALRDLMGDTHCAYWMGSTLADEKQQTSGMPVFREQRQWNTTHAVSHA